MRAYGGERRRTWSTRTIDQRRPWGSLTFSRIFFFPNEWVLVFGLPSMKAGIWILKRELTQLWTSWSNYRGPGGRWVVRIGKPEKQKWMLILRFWAKGLKGDLSNSLFLWSFLTNVLSKRGNDTNFLLF